MITWVLCKTVLPSLPLLMFACLFTLVVPRDQCHLRHGLCLYVLQWNVPYFIPMSDIDAARDLRIDAFGKMILSEVTHLLPPTFLHLPPLSLAQCQIQTSDWIAPNGGGRTGDEWEVSMLVSEVTYDFSSQWDGSSVIKAWMGQVFVVCFTVILLYSPVAQGKVIIKGTTFISLSLSLSLSLPLTLSWIHLFYPPLSPSLFCFPSFILSLFIVFVYRLWSIIPMIFVFVNDLS